MVRSLKGQRHHDHRIPKYQIINGETKSEETHACPGSGPGQQRAL